MNSGSAMPPRLSPSRGQHGFHVLAVEAGNMGDADPRRTGRFAFIGIGASAESLCVVLVHHRKHALLALGCALRQLGEVRDLGGSKEHGGGVLARGDTRTATNADSRI